MDTKKKTTADRLCRIIFDGIPNCTLVKCEKYWKEPSLYELEFTSSLEPLTPNENLIELFSVINTVSSSWSIEIPSEIHKGELEFSGTTEDTKIRGTTWASFLVQDTAMSVV